MALPICQKRISPLLDAATRLLVVTCRQGTEVRRREILLGALSGAALVDKVAELQVDVLLCAAVTAPLFQALKQRGVQVRAHLCGEAEAVLRAFCGRKLARSEFRMPGCLGRERHRFHSCRELKLLPRS